MFQRLRRPWTALLVCVLTASLLGTEVQASDAPVVGAASDLQFALPEIVRSFEAATGRRIRLTFGASGNLARQIEQGAPFQMFLSADEQFVLRLVTRGLTRDRGVLYATGHLVLFAPDGSALAAALSVDHLRAALAAGDVQRFAIANPEHAPYGRAARQWLQTHGLWEPIQPALVLGENVAQTAQFATTGNAQAGILPYSLARAPQIARRGRYVLLSTDDHQPLNQRMVLMRQAGATAEQFYQYMQEPAARQILRRHGFLLPGEAAH